MPYVSWSFDSEETLDHQGLSHHGGWGGGGIIIGVFIPGALFHACICLHARSCDLSKKVLLNQAEILDVFHNMRQDVFTWGPAHCWGSWTKDQSHHTVYSLHDPCCRIARGVVSGKVSDTAVVRFVRTSNVVFFSSGLLVTKLLAFILKSPLLIQQKAKRQPLL